MELHLDPAPDDATAEAVARAVARAGIELAEPPAAYRSPWRRAATAEAAHHSDPVAEAIVEHVDPR